MVIVVMTIMVMVMGYHSVDEEVDGHRRDDDNGHGDEEEEEGGPYYDNCLNNDGVLLISQC